MLQIGVLGSQFHLLLNQVALIILHIENESLLRLERPKIEFHIPQTPNRRDVLVRAEVRSLRQGSVEIDLATQIALVFSNPHAIDVLKNLSARAIWVLAKYITKVPGVKIVKNNTSQKDPYVKETVSKRRLSTVATKLIKELKDTANGGRLELRSGDEELIIEINSRENSNSYNDPPF